MSQSQTRAATIAVDTKPEQTAEALTRMDRDEAVALLKEAEAELRAKGVLHAALFGSVARGDARHDSDIDIMVELDPEARVGVWGFVSIVQLIEDRFSRKVDVSEREALRPFVRPSAERDAIYAF